MFVTSEMLKTIARPFDTLSSLLSTAPKPGMRATALDAPGSDLYASGGKWAGDPGRFASDTDANYVAYLAAIAAGSAFPAPEILVGPTPATAVAMSWSGFGYSVDGIPTFASTTERNAAIPNPSANQSAWVTGIGETVWAGPLATDWLPIIAGAKASDYRVNKNLFNPATTTPGFIDENSDEIIASDVYFTSDFIPVVPAVYSFATRARFVAFYNSAQVHIPIRINCELAQRINVPSNCAFMRVTFREVNRAAAAVYKGDSQNALSGPGNQANACNIGGCADSLGGTGWQTLVATATGCALNIDTNGGTLISGSLESATAMCNDTRALAPSIFSRALLLMGGTNDWAQSVPLGTKASVDQTTFYGALNVLLKKWTDKYVDARIFVCTLNYGNMPARVTAATWADPEVNTQGLRTMDYAEAMRDRATYWGCSIIDCARDAGINNGNKALYITNDGNYLHHNAKGIRRIAPLIINAINGILE